MIDSNVGRWKSARLFPVLDVRDFPSWAGPIPGQVSYAGPAEMESDGIATRAGEGG